MDKHLLQDWTDLHTTLEVEELFQITADHITKVAQELAMEVIEATSEDAHAQNLTELKSLGQDARLEVAEFTKWWRKPTPQSHRISWLQL